MKKSLVLMAALGLAAAFQGCVKDDSVPTLPSYGSSSPVASMVAVGNSLTAGFQSGALFVDGQNAAFPNLIARQLGLDPLTHVDIAYPGIGGTPGFGRYEMVVGENGPSLVPQAYEDPNALFADQTAAPPYSNLGIPGELLQECLSAVDAATSLGGNSFFDFVLQNAATGLGTQLQQAIVQTPQLATFWLGNNDVLGYATSGGTTPIGPYGAGFDVFYGLALDSLASHVDYVITANLPNVTVIPYVNYIGSTLAGNQLYGMVEGSVQALRAGQDYALLPLLSVDRTDPDFQYFGFTPDQPLPDDMVLDAAEVATVQAAVAEYNAVIAQVVEGLNAGRQHPILLVDFNSFFEDLATYGYSADGVTLTTDFISGGLFSLDGVHPSYPGYAVVANQFIQAMVDGWQWNVPLVDVIRYLDEVPTFGQAVDPGDLTLDPHFGENIRALFER